MMKIFDRNWMLGLLIAALMGIACGVGCHELNIHGVVGDGSTVLDAASDMMEDASAAVD